MQTETNFDLIRSGSFDGSAVRNMQRMSIVKTEVGGTPKIGVHQKMRNKRAKKQLQGEGACQSCEQQCLLM